MHFRSIFTALGMGSFALLLLAPEGAQAWGRRFYGGPVYYQPVYYQPCMPTYYAPLYYQPMYYSAPAYRPAPLAGQVVEVGAYDKVGFRPKTITVAPGTTVRWVNHGKEHHTVTSRDGLFDSGPLAHGATYSATFLRPGTYHYFCRPHEKLGMVGTVVVGSVGSGGGGSGYSGSGY